MPNGVTVQGPDGNTYQFPDGTTKESAIAYFKKKGVGASQQSASSSTSTIGPRKPETMARKLENWWTSAKEYGGTLDRPGKSPQDIAKDLGKGAAVGSLPLLGYGMAAAPLATSLGIGGSLAGGYVGGKAGGYVGGKVGAPQLGEDIGSFTGATIGGGVGAKVGSAASGAISKAKVDPIVKINELLKLKTSGKSAEIKLGSTPESLQDFAQNPGRGLLKSGLDEKTLSKMKPLERNAAITKAKNDVGKQLETLFKNASQPQGLPGGLPEQAGQMPKSGKKVDFQKVMDSVFDEKVIPDKNLAKQTAERLHQIIDKSGVTGKLLSELTPEEAWKIRKELDEFANFQPAETAKSFSQVATMLRRGLSDALHKAVPESAPLDQHYTDLYGANKASRRQATEWAANTPSSKLRKWIIKSAVKAGTGISVPGL